MRLLMIATGYPPYLFSENLCNGKLVMALLQAGIEVDVISRIDEGPLYGTIYTLMGYLSIENSIFYS